MPGMNSIIAGMAAVKIYADPRQLAKDLKTAEGMTDAAVQRMARQRVTLGGGSSLSLALGADLARAERLARASAERISSIPVTFGGRGMGAALAAQLALAEKRTAQTAAKMQASMAAAFSPRALVMGGGIMWALQATTRFDDKMRLLQATIRGTEDSLYRLRRAAIDTSSKNRLSLPEVAEGMVGLARMGFNEKEIKDAIKPVTDLAQATGTDLAQATLIAANVMRAFQKRSGDMTRIIDLLTVTANGSAQSLIDVGESMKHAASSGALLGESIEDVCAQLMMLANLGIRGEMAGTALRRIATQFADPKVQALLAQHGVQVIDPATRNLRRRVDVMKDIGKAMEKMGNADQLAFAAKVFEIRGMNAGAMLALRPGDTEAALEKLSKAAGAGAASSAETMKGLGGAMAELANGVTALGDALSNALVGPAGGAMRSLGKFFVNLSAFVGDNKETISALAELAVTLLKVAMAAKGLQLAGRALSGFNGMMGGAYEGAMGWLRGPQIPVDMRGGAMAALGSLPPVAALAPLPRRGLPAAVMGAKQAAAATPFRAPGAEGVALPGASGRGVPGELAPYQRLISGAEAANAATARQREMAVATLRGANQTMAAAAMRYDEASTAYGTAYADVRDRVAALGASRDYTEESFNVGTRDRIAQGLEEQTKELGGLTSATQKQMGRIAQELQRVKRGGNALWKGSPIYAAAQELIKARAEQRSNQIENATRGRVITNKPLDPLTDLDKAANEFLRNNGAGNLAQQLNASNSAFDPELMGTGNAPATPEVTVVPPMTMDEALAQLRNMRVNGRSAWDALAKRQDEYYQEKAGMSYQAYQARQRIAESIPQLRPRQIEEYLKANPRDARRFDKELPGTFARIDELVGDNAASREAMRLIDTLPPLAKATERAGEALTQATERRDRASAALSAVPGARTPLEQSRLEYERRMSDARSQRQTNARAYTQARAMFPDHPEFAQQIAGRGRELREQERLLRSQQAIIEERLRLESGEAAYDAARLRALQAQERVLREQLALIGNLNAAEKGRAEARRGLQSAREARDFLARSGASMEERAAAGRDAQAATLEASRAGLMAQIARRRERMGEIALADPSAMGGAEWQKLNAETAALYQRLREANARVAAFAKAADPESMAASAEQARAAAVAGHEFARQRLQFARQGGASAAELRPLHEDLARAYYARETAGREAQIAQNRAAMQGMAYGGGDWAAAQAENKRLQGEIAALREREARVGQPRPAREEAPAETVARVREETAAARAADIKQARADADRARAEGMAAGTWTPRQQAIYESQQKGFGYAESAVGYSAQAARDRAAGNAAGAEAWTKHADALAQSATLQDRVTAAAQEEARAVQDVKAARVAVQQAQAAGASEADVVKLKAIERQAAAQRVVAGHMARIAKLQAQHNDLAQRGLSTAAVSAKLRREEIALAEAQTRAEQATNQQLTLRGRILQGLKGAALSVGKAIAGMATGMVAMFALNAVLGAVGALADKLLNAAENARELQQSLHQVTKETFDDLVKKLDEVSNETTAIHFFQKFEDDLFNARMAASGYEGIPYEQLSDEAKIAKRRYATLQSAKEMMADHNASSWQDKAANARKTIAAAEIKTLQKELQDINSAISKLTNRGWIMQKGDAVLDAIGVLGSWVGIDNTWKDNAYLVNDVAKLSNMAAQIGAEILRLKGVSPVGSQVPEAAAAYANFSPRIAGLKSEAPAARPSDNPYIKAAADFVAAKEAADAKLAEYVEGMKKILEEVKDALAKTTDAAARAELEKQAADVEKEIARAEEQHRKDQEAALAAYDKAMAGRMEKGAPAKRASDNPYVKSAEDFAKATDEETKKHDEYVQGLEEWIADLEERIKNEPDFDKQTALIKKQTAAQQAIAAAHETTAANLEALNAARKRQLEKEGRDNAVADRARGFAEAGGDAAAQHQARMAGLERDAARLQREISEEVRLRQEAGKSLGDLAGASERVAAALEKQKREEEKRYAKERWEKDMAQGGTEEQRRLASAVPFASLQTPEGAGRAFGPGQSGWRVFAAQIGGRAYKAGEDVEWAIGQRQSLREKIAAEDMNSPWRQVLQERLQSLEGFAQSKQEQKEFLASRYSQLQALIAENPLGQQGGAGDFNAASAINRAFLATDADPKTKILEEMRMYEKRMWQILDAEKPMVFN